MEAREFFKGSPMHEITVSGTPEEWAVIAAVLDGTLDYAALADDMVDLLQSVGVTY